MLCGNVVKKKKAEAVLDRSQTKHITHTSDTHPKHMYVYDVHVCLCMYICIDVYMYMKMARHGAACVYPDSKF